MITHDQVLTAFNYDPESGNLTWRVKRWRRHGGSIAGWDCPNGYRKVTFWGRNYYVHRLIFFYMTGSWPRNQIDHINCRRRDNRWENLREASLSQNMQNKSVRKDSKVGLKGVTTIKKTGRFEASISVDGKRKYLGNFGSPVEAHAAYVTAARKLFGEFAFDGVS